jgi:hypothetical protein
MPQEKALYKIHWKRLLAEMGAPKPEDGIFEPVCEPMGAEEKDTFVKFMSDGGRRDNELGDLFVPWLLRNGFSFDRFYEPEEEGIPESRRKFTIYGKLEIM